MALLRLALFVTINTGSWPMARFSSNGTGIFRSPNNPRMAYEKLAGYSP